MHVFQMLNRVLPEADAAMRETSRFIHEMIPRRKPASEAA